MKYWKQWPYWLRGGVIGGGFAILSSVLSLSCLYFLASPGSWGFECIPIEIPWIPFWFFPSITFLPSIIYEVLVLVVWFSVAAFIGALVGYIKNKRAHFRVNSYNTRKN